MCLLEIGDHEADLISPREQQQQWDALLVVSHRGMRAAWILHKMKDAVNGWNFAGNV